MKGLPPHPLSVDSDSIRFYIGTWGEMYSRYRGKGICSFANSSSWILFVFIRGTRERVFDVPGERYSYLGEGIWSTGDKTHPINIGLNAFSEIYPPY